MTHFSSADDPASDDYTKQQIDSFNWLLDEMERRGRRFRYVHAANTAALVRFPATHYNMVRPGLGIYGMYPSEAVRSLIHLEQVVTFCTKIAQIKEHPPGRCISYNRSFVTSRACRIATLHVGYNDGYPRFQSNIGEVLVQGRRAPVVGTVCMDTIMIDVTDIPDARVGDEVVLIGGKATTKSLPMKLQPTATPSITKSYARYPPSHESVYPDVSLGAEEVRHPLRRDGAPLSAAKLKRHMKRPLRANKVGNTMWGIGGGKWSPPQSRRGDALFELQSPRRSPGVSGGAAVFHDSLWLVSSSKP